LVEETMNSLGIGSNLAREASYGEFMATLRMKLKKNCEMGKKFQIWKVIENMMWSILVTWTYTSGVDI
jgi:hypothetical protein